VLGVSSDDGVRLWFNDELKVDSWRQRGEMVDSFRVQLEAAKKYSLRIEYFDVGGDAACRLWWRTPTAKAKEYTAQIEAAKKSDLVIAVIGTGLYNEREGHDKESLNLPGDQEAMLQAVYKANPNTVVVLVTGSQHTIGWMQENVPAIINAWYPGEQGGQAIAHVLFGKYNPAGRLPLTYYEQMDSLPPMEDYEIKKGRTYMYYKGHPLYAFGYGLSYTSFAYSNAKATATGDNIAVSFSITNKGSMDGDEVPQVYSYLTNEEGRQVRQLRAFGRVHVKKGETKKVVLNVRRKELAYWSEEDRNWKLYTGNIQLQVGASSADIRQRINLTLK
jgi:beta-glucosidase